MKKVFLALMAVAAIALTGCNDNTAVQEYNFNIANSTDRVVGIMTGYMDGQTFMMLDDAIRPSKDTAYNVMLTNRASGAYLAVIVGNSDVTYPTSIKYLDYNKDTALTKLYSLNPVPEGKKIYVSVNQDGNHVVNYAD